MSQLDSLTVEDQELIISLPYRVGIWLSHADDEGGEGDDEQEMATLENILDKIAQTHRKSAFVRDVIGRTVAARDKWPEWEGRVFTIEDDAKKAMSRLVGTLDEKDWKTYRGMLVHIGRSVAESYGEFGEEEDDEDDGFFGRILGNLKSKDANDEDVAHMNISPSEEAALKTLADALRAGSVS